MVEGENVLNAILCTLYSILEIISLYMILKICPNMPKLILIYIAGCTSKDRRALKFNNSEQKKIEINEIFRRKITIFCENI